jgi:hypothetical protein
MMTSMRQRLPNRRGCENFSFQCGGLSYVATISRFQNGDLAEIVSNHKTGGDAVPPRATALSFAVSVVAFINVRDARLGRAKEGAS